jgi:RNA polymerase sigma factor (sigma-70 family)
MNAPDPGSSVLAASSRFNTTHWSVVLQAGREVSPHSSAALEKLCRAYWYPLYAFIRRKGFGEADAQDLTQQFFARLLERRDFASVDPRKGKFRTFLLASLSHFLSNERDRARAAKRGGGQTPIPLDGLQPEERYRLEPVNDSSPDKLYEVRWALTVLEQALSRLRQEMADAGKSVQFDQLKAYLVEDPGAGDYAAAAERLGGSRQSVAVTVHRLRQRYREIVRAEVAQTVTTPLELEEELRHLYSVLNP